MQRLQKLIEDFDADKYRTKAVKSDIKYKGYDIEIYQRGWNKRFVGANSFDKRFPDQKHQDYSTIDRAIAREKLAIDRQLSGSGYQDNVNEETILATAPTEDRLLKMINQYFYSTTFKLDPDGETLHNAKGIVNNFKVGKKGSRYQFIQK